MNKRIERNGAMDFHVLPPHGLLNDPNGLVYFKGTSHIFFQWNPQGLDHSYKCWGHATTEDLVHYTYHEAALLPDEDYDRNGCYSGSALVHEDRLYLFYTGNVKNAEGERESYQCVAVSEDGFTFRKLGPVITTIDGYTPHVRDPKVFRHHDGDFYMVLGAQREDLTGDTVVFRSEDLLSWTFQGSLMENRHHLGYMWECPDLIRFPEEDVFIFSPQGLEREGERFRNIFQTGYLTGKFQGGKFLEGQGSFDEMDRGFEYYAPQSFIHPDGRILSMGWMGTMEKEKEEALPTLPEGWVHHLSVIRELSLSGEGKLLQRPVRELSAYRSQGVQETSKTFQGAYGSPLEICLALSEKTESFRLDYADEVTLSYNEGWFQVERTDWSSGEREDRKVLLSKELQEIRVLMDHTSMEIFINDGEEVFSLRFFRKEENDSLRIEADKDMEIRIYEFII